MLSSLLLPLLVSQASERIVLTPSMVLNETAVGEAVRLVDEQRLVGDPASGSGTPPKRPFFPGWTAWQYPISVAIDLGSECRVDRVFLYNESGSSPVELSTRRPFHWRPRPVSLEGYQKWVEVPINEPTRWLRLTLTKPTSIPELLVYGKRTKPVDPEAPVKRRRPLTPMDQLIGTNAFIDDPMERIIPPSGVMREYHPWGWDVENKDGLTRFQPSAAAGGNAWFFDDYYGKLKKAGVTVAPVVWQSPEALFGTASREHKPIAKEANSEDPRSYAKHAAHFFQWAARYGSRKVADGLLDLAPGQPRRSGLGLLRYLENWNEPDKNWEGRDGWFSPYELAAMSSADRDGHQGQLGPKHGIRAADPSMRLVAGGLAGLNLDYVRAMKLWADEYRKGDFPADAINLHHYSSTAGGQGWVPGTTALSPEADRLVERLQAFTDWRDRHMPDREVWFSEFGYDTNEGSPIYARPIGSMSAQQVQAAWIVRGFLACAAARVDRAMMFMLRDVNSKGKGVFETSGLVSEKGSWNPKVSWHAVSTLRRELKGMRFAGEVPSGRPDVRIYRFEGAGSQAFVAWCPTSEDRRVPGFRLKVSGSAPTGVNLPNGQSRPLQASGGAVTLDISEMPTIVKLKVAPASRR